MDADNCALACGLVSQSYITQGSQALASRRNLIKALLSNRRMPETGWDEASIEMLIQVGVWVRMREAEQHPAAELTECGYDVLSILECNSKKRQAMYQ